jgi:CheY-like chemotaxis protein
MPKMRWRGAQDGRVEDSDRTERPLCPTAHCRQRPGFSGRAAAAHFEPYVTTKARGTGLGLPIVKKIVDEHQGSIEISNAPARRARIDIRCRWSRRRRPSMAIILVVDDEVGIRELLSEILIDEGYDVRLAENASAARKVRDELRPDLVLLDIWMPDTDGISLLKEWHAGGHLNMPVVMMSGHGTIDTAVEATRFGAFDFWRSRLPCRNCWATVQKALKHDAPPPRPPLTLDAFSRLAFVKEFRRRLDQAGGQGSGRADQGGDRRDGGNCCPDAAGPARALA